MSARSARKYLSRVQAACAVQGAGTDLSEEARQFVLQPLHRVSAQIFRELLSLGYVESHGRTWRWTAKARAVNPGEGR